MDDFKELSKATLSQIMAFNIKSRSVLKSFKRSCKLIEAFLHENNFKYSAESAEQWLSEYKNLKKGTRSQQNLYLSYRRASLLLLDFQAGQLTEWKKYTCKIAKIPKTQYYLNLLILYKRKRKRIDA